MCVFERFSAGNLRLVNIQSRGTLLAFVGLTANAPHRVDRLVYFGDLRADGLEQVELLLQFFLRGGEARVFEDRKRLGVDLITRLKLDLVSTRWHQRTLHDLL